ncbi:MAG: phosphonate ABC transporter ATP-binding protein [Pseudomonadota bacterium]|nr:phosphonate ABC transporter ATP-binding protein [Pseudomonadota bacterium]MEE3295396.1 phosphonate ABC transporter ATP-binding protein [Pseudomonadota bacterium]
MGSLRLNSLIKQFGKNTDGRIAVNCISLEVTQGEMVGIIGKSGAGKSTLLRMINRLVEPTSGSISFDGTDVTSLKGKALKKWRSECAMIFQQFHLIDRLDVLTNVLTGTLGRRYNLLNILKIFPKEEKINALKALHKLDLSNKALQRVETLSGGEQQRVAIARALMQKPKILLADEPISSLDPKNSKIVMDDIKKINNDEGITVICNLHSLEVAKQYSRRLIGLSEGKIVFDGPPENLTQELSQELYDLENE